MIRRHTIAAGRSGRPVQVEQHRSLNPRTALARLRAGPVEVDGEVWRSETRSATKPDFRGVSATGLLAADVCRNLLPGGKFGRLLWGWM